MAISDTITELQEELASVKAAILKAEKQQNYSLDDGQGKMSVGRANLQTLYDERDRLRKEILELQNIQDEKPIGFYGRTT